VYDLPLVNWSLFIMYCLILCLVYRHQFLLCPTCADAMLLVSTEALHLFTIFASEMYTYFLAARCNLSEDHEE